MRSDDGRTDPPGWVQRYRALTQLGFPRSYPLVQFPNTPLWVAIVAAVVGWFVDGVAEDYARAVGLVGIVVWGWMELVDGVNLFRHALGAVVLIDTIIGLAAKVN